MLDGELAGPRIGYLVLIVAQQYYNVHLVAPDVFLRGLSSVAKDMPLNTRVRRAQSNSPQAAAGAFPALQRRQANGI